MADIRQGFMRRVSVTFSKADGSPGVVEGLPTWDLSDPSVAGLEVAADAMSGMVKHNGSTGAVTLTIRADGDLGAGVNAIVVVPEAFEMLAPLGAVGGVASIGEEEPVTPLVP